jgi:hypothetical protein
METISSAPRKALQGNQITANSTEELISLAEELKQKGKQFTIVRYLQLVIQLLALYPFSVNQVYFLSDY